MARFGLICVLFGALAWGQAGAPAPHPAPSDPALSAPQSAAAASEPDLPPDATVITIEGVCDQPAADKSCKTVITRSQFEDAIRAIQPNIPPAQQRRQFASRYAMLVIFADQAHKLGLDRGPKFEEQLKLTRMEVAARTLGQDMQERSGSVTDKEVADYYQAHSTNYEKADVQQIFIPRSRKPEVPTKPGPPPATKAPSGTEDAIKKEVEALHARAAAGEDFGKLQTEAYQFSGMKTKPPETTVKDLRRNTVSPNRALVFDLKPGEVSKIIADPTGYFIYKLDKKDTVPVEKVRAEIESAVKAQKLQASIQGIEHGAAPKLDEKYFGPAQAQGPVGPQGAVPNPMVPQGPQTPPAAAPTTK